MFVSSCKTAKNNIFGFSAREIVQISIFKVEYLENGVADFNDLGLILQDFEWPFKWNQLVLALQFFLKKNKERLQDKDVSRKPIDCYNCGNRVSEPIIKHKEHCPAKNVKCCKCGKFNYFAKVCRSQKDVRHVDESKEDKQ